MNRFATLSVTDKIKLLAAVNLLLVIIGLGGMAWGLIALNERISALEHSSQATAVRYVSVKR